MSLFKAVGSNNEFPFTSSVTGVKEEIKDWMNKLKQRDTLHVHEEISLFSICNEPILLGIREKVY